jgi:hypothetical protein
VVRADGGKESGMMSVRIRFRAEDGTIADSVLTDQSGEFYYIGLPPGKYTAEVDVEQLDRMRLSCDDPTAPITIRATTEGDLVEGLKFVVHPWSSAYGNR